MCSCHAGIHFIYRVCLFRADWMRIFFDSVTPVFEYAGGLVFFLPGGLEWWLDRNCEREDVLIGLVPKLLRSRIVMAVQSSLLCGDEWSTRLILPRSMIGTTYLCTLYSRRF